MQSAWCALLQDIELMPQYQDFGFQPPPRLDTVAQHADEQAGDRFSNSTVSQQLLHPITLAQMSPNEG